MTNSSCSVCGGQETYSVYKLPRIPAFQNKLFRTPEAAMAAPVATVDLRACPVCDFVFNAEFNANVMNYDEDYQNSQEHSPSFKSYLSDIADKITAAIKPDDKIIEIGCGKGFFLNHLRERGRDIIGFDPTYEGDDPSIVKSYFDKETAGKVTAQVAVMRHTLEHIEQPFNFLKDLKEILPKGVKIFIEVPRFEWIVEHRAFWDIFHEHCNYFTERFFRGVFAGKAKITPVFDDQYMLIEANMDDLLDTAAKVDCPSYTDIFKSELDRYAGMLQDFDTHYVWGAGAKGIAFVNTMDMRQQKVKAIIDINEKKQGHFASLTGHACISPAAVDWQSLTEKDCLWIMNGLYQREIMASLPPLKCAVRVMGEIR